MSPLFHRRSEEEKAAAQAAAQARREDAERSDERTAASLAQIEQGHIPRRCLGAPGAVRTGRRRARGVQQRPGGERMERARAAGRHSDHTGDGLVDLPRRLAADLLQRPHRGAVLSDAYNESRRLALGRLLEEAQACRADAVVAVRIEQGAHDWAAGAVEFIAVGTAVRLPRGVARPRRTGAAQRSLRTGVRAAVQCRLAAGGDRCAYQRALRPGVDSDPAGAELVRRLVGQPGARRLQRRASMKRARRRCRSSPRRCGRSAGTA